MIVRQTLHLRGNGACKHEAVEQKALIIMEEMSAGTVGTLTPGTFRRFPDGGVSWYQAPPSWVKSGTFSRRLAVEKRSRA